MLLQDNSTLLRTNCRKLMLI